MVGDPAAHTRACVKPGKNVASCAALLIKPHCALPRARRTTHVRGSAQRSSRKPSTGVSFPREKVRPDPPWGPPGNLEVYGPTCLPPCPARRSRRSSLRSWTCWRMHATRCRTKCQCCSRCGTRWARSGAAIGFPKQKSSSLTYEALPSNNLVLRQFS